MATNADTVRRQTQRTIEAMFLQGRPYTETEQYRAMVAAAESGRPRAAYGCTDVAQVHAYFRRLMDTYESMKRSGYLSQRELGIGGDDEIGIFVTRDGQLCIANGGNHRLRIAELLEILDVPVRIEGIHAFWAEEACQRHSQHNKMITKAIEAAIADIAVVQPKIERTAKL